MKTMPIVLFASLVASLSSLGCEINTCEGQECGHTWTAPSCNPSAATDGGGDADSHGGSLGDAAPLVEDAALADATPLVDAASVGADARPPAMCQVNGDCAINEDCIGGSCLTRCKASCQCRLGEACVGGYCTTGQSSPPACATDCDCLAGQSCVSGACL